MYSIQNSIPYLIIFSFLFLLSFPIYSNGKNVHINLSFQKYTIFLILLYFVSLRAYIQTDWINYKIFFDELPRFSFSSFFWEAIKKNKYFDNFLFLNFAIIVKTIFNNYLFFQFCCSFIDLLFYCFFFSKICNKKFALAFVFFFLFDGLSLEFNLLRNIKSIILFLFSLQYIKTKKFVIYLLINLLGSLFHTSSLIYLPLYFILDKHFNRKIVFLFFLLGQFIYLFKVKWVSIIIIPLLDSFAINSTVLSLLQGYLKLQGTAGITIGFIERTATFLLFFYFEKKLIKSNPMNIIIINCLYIYFFINILFSELFIFTSRASYLFVFSYWVLYPQIYQLLSKKRKLLFIYLLMLYGVSKTLLDYKSNIFKYENILSTYQTYEQRKSSTMKIIKAEKQMLKK